MAAAVLGIGYMLGQGVVVLVSKLREKRRVKKQLKRLAKEGTLLQPTTLEGLADIQRVLTDGVSAHLAAATVDTVEVHSSSLAYFPPLLTTLTKLTKLDMAGCSLPYLPFLISSLVNLKDLSMSRNQLRYLPDELGQLANLRTLDLSFNQLPKLPDSMCGLTQLEVCNLMGNQLQQLPADFGKLTSIRLLGLKSNKLTSLPDSFSCLTSLVELFITDNCLTHFPKGFGRLSSLVKLQASFNSLEEVPEEVADLPRLEMMRVAVCNISSLPSSITHAEPSQGSGGASAKWGSLAWFSLGGNPACASMPAPRQGLKVVPDSDVQLHEKLGDGASGEVLRAMLHGQEVAVKFFRADVSPDGRTAEEVAIACAVDHPHLTRVVATIQAKNNPLAAQPAGTPSAAPGATAGLAAGGQASGATAVAALVMDICSGKPLAAKPTSAHLLRCKWDSSETMSMAFAHKVALGVASALAYLHSMCICHGDVYAHNILVDQQGHATLCDFGAAFCYEPGQQAFWEAMEVRAMGLFLKDIANQVTTAGAKLVLPEEEKRQAAAPGQDASLLVQLSQRCLHADPLSRPSFSQLQEALS